jgi:hypothetical protein
MNALVFVKESLTNKTSKPVTEKVGKESNRKDRHLPLLVIELNELNGVPKVFYKGEEITKKLHVGFDWHTRTDRIKYGSPFIDIEYFADNEVGPHTRSIRYNGHFKKSESDD